MAKQLSVMIALIFVMATTMTQSYAQSPPNKVLPPPVNPATSTPEEAIKEYQHWIQNNGAQNRPLKAPGAPFENQPSNGPPGPGLTPPGTQPSTAPGPVLTSPENQPPPLGVSTGGVLSSVPTTTPNNMQPPKNPPPPPNWRQPLTYEQGQQVMLSQAPPADLSPSEESALAFDALLRQNTPLSPQQIIQLRQHIDRSQRAAAVPPNIPPKPVSSTIMINLAPGTTPPAVRLSQGYVTSLVFVDSTGAPWPIAAFDIGNPKAVQPQWDGKSNILLIQALQPYTNGDIVFRLVGLPTPITLELVAGQRVVDFRVDIHVTGIGPNAKEIPTGTSLPNSANQLLLGVLDGIGPAGSKALVVHGADAQAWMLGSRIYLRTRLTVLSPGWIGTMVSPDGMHAYELPKTSSILVSRYGEPVALKIGGF